MKILIILPFAALALASCQPLNGTDPLDSGELAREASDISTSRDSVEQNRIQDERLDRYSGPGLRVIDPESETRISAGVNANSDF
ncbi:hypothetical protein [Haloferula sargassicola]